MATQGKAKSGRHDPWLAFAFSVEIDQRRVAGFSEVSGLAIETEIETLRVGGLNSSEWQLPGPAKFPARLVLKRGMGDIDFLWKWYEGVAKGMIVRKDIVIHLLDAHGDKRRSWHFRQACPVKWTGPELHAGGSDVAFETVELVHRGVEP